MNNVDMRARMFLNGSVNLARQYNVSLGHEDEQGAFVVHDTAQENMFVWLKNAGFDGEDTDVWMQRNKEMW